MYIHYSDNQITLQWTVFRGVSVCPEDFKRSKVVCLLDSHSNKVPVEVDVVQGVKGQYLSIIVPSGLPEGVYDLLAVWTKNEGRSIARSRIDGAFAVTFNASESTDKGSATTDTKLRFRSSAGTYGYDGLSAYELALLKGLTTKDETTWVKEQIDECRERIETLRDESLNAITALQSEALDNIGEAGSTALDDINQRVSGGLASVDAGIAEAETAITAMQTEAVSSGQSALASTKAEALTQLANARTTALSDIESAGEDATAAVGTAIETAVSAVSSIYNVDLTTLYDQIFTYVNPVGTQTYYTINADSTMWENVGRSNWIAVTPGKTYRITAANHIFDWAFMTSNERNNNTPVTTFAEGWTAKAVLGANESVIATAPADAAYIYYKTGSGFVAAKDIRIIEPVAMKAYSDSQDAVFKNEAEATVLKELFPTNIREQGKMGTNYIDANQKWVTTSGWRSWWTPITGGGTYAVRASASSSLVIALLTSDTTTVNQSVSTWATGWSERMVLAPGEVAVLKAPDDARWLQWAKSGTASTVPATPNAPQFVLDGGAGNAVLADLDTLRYEIQRHGFNGKYTGTDNITVKCQDFATALNGAAGRADTMLFMTDPHLMSSGGAFSEASEMIFKRSIGLMLKYWQSLPLEHCVCGGDWLNQDDTPARAAWKLGYVDGTMKKLFGPGYHHMVGNHDTNYIGTAEGGQTSLKAYQVRNLFFRSEGSSFYSFSMGAGRAYVFDTWTATTAGGMPADYAGLFTDQVLWFGSQLLEKDDAHNVLFLHAYYSSNVATATKFYLATQVEALAAAYNNRGTFTFSGRTFDFASCTGAVHCIIAGHTHEDAVIDSGDIPVMITTNMQAGGKATFDLIVFDYDALRLQTIRVGTGEGRLMTLANHV